MLKEIKGLFRSAPTERRAQGEQGSSYYNEAFASNGDWQAHYSASPYYFLWTVIVDRLRRRGSDGILEIACGPGQLASAICDAGITANYTGFDFSDVAIEYARKACPQYRFVQEDALKTAIFEQADYDCVVSTEFLEHVEDEISVLAKIRSGAYVIATVPNFPYVSHVRHFFDSNGVTDRYGHLFNEFNVVEICGTVPDHKFFLLEGIRK